MRAPLACRCHVPTADVMKRLGERVGRALRAGDLVVLTGELGAGKTTLAQGIGRGLGITEPITSPTFVISRVHRNAAGPDLVHVDAYRLRGLAEIDDLDLESDAEGAVIVAEWGAGLVEGMSESRLSVRIERSFDGDDERRTVEIESMGERWHPLFSSLGREFAA